MSSFTSNGEKELTDNARRLLEEAISFYPSVSARNLLKMAEEWLSSTVSDNEHSSTLLVENNSIIPCSDSPVLPRKDKKHTCLTSKFSECSRDLNQITSRSLDSNLHKGPPKVQRSKSFQARCPKKNETSKSTDQPVSFLASSFGAFASFSNEMDVSSSNDSSVQRKRQRRSSDTFNLAQMGEILDDSPSIQHRQTLRQLPVRSTSVSYFRPSLVGSSPESDIMMDTETTNISSPIIHAPSPKVCESPKLPDATMQLTPVRKSIDENMSTPKLTSSTTPLLSGVARFKRTAANDENRNTANLKNFLNPLDKCNSFPVFPTKFTTPVRDQVSRCTRDVSKHIHLCVTNDIRLIALDFDQTFLNFHTGSRWSGPAAELLPFVRPVFKSFVIEAIEAGLVVSIVTFSSQTDLITKLLQLVFKDTIVLGHNMFVCGATPDPLSSHGRKSPCNNWLSPTRFGKKNHIRSACVKVQDATGCDVIRPEQVLLIDDDKNNVRVAHENGTKAVLFKATEGYTTAENQLLSDIWTKKWHI